MQDIITIIIAIFASSGFWLFVQTVWQNRNKEKSAEIRLLMGLAYDSLIQRCNMFIERGYITLDEYKDLKKYLYDPYIELGGNGGGKKIWAELEKLPMKEKED